MWDHQTHHIYKKMEMEWRRLLVLTHAVNPFCHMFNFLTALDGRIEAMKSIKVVEQFSQKSHSVPVIVILLNITPRWGRNREINFSQIFLHSHLPALSHRHSRESYIYLKSVKCSVDETSFARRFEMFRENPNLSGFFEFTFEIKTDWTARKNWKTWNWHEQIIKKWEEIFFVVFISLLAPTCLIDLSI